MGRLMELNFKKGILENSHELLVLKPNRTSEEDVFLSNFPAELNVLQNTYDNLLDLNDEIWY
eukprot:Awhi_evm1s14197